jgi:hypothetical protein
LTHRLFNNVVVTAEVIVIVGHVLKYISETLNSTKKYLTEERNLKNYQEPNSLTIRPVIERSETHVDPLHIFLHASHNPLHLNVG